VGASVANEAPARHGLATMAAFVTAGAIPLFGFALGLPASAQFAVIVMLAIATLAFVGGARSKFTGRPRTRCAFEMVAIGGSASALAYLLGLAVEPLVLP
jgi:VIT1/CCC1 family predicted Fe2+/Mn2+ transporter